MTGNEDGAHHVIAEVAQSLVDIGYTVPGQAWTYWHGPGPGQATWRARPARVVAQTGRNAAANLSRRLQAHRLPVPGGA